MRSFDYSVSELIGPLNEVELKNAPKRLYIAGDVGLLGRGSRVSVVGSRAVSEHGRIRARDLTAALVEKQIVVVSGLAAGICSLGRDGTKGGGIASFRFSSGN